MIGVGTSTMGDRFALPEPGQIWRGRTFDAYVKIIETKDGMVKVQPTDIGLFANRRDTSAPYDIGVGSLNRSWRVYK